MKKFSNVYVIGVFDLFHRGHVEFLRMASSYGERLIVAINGDLMVSQYKRKPLYSEADRLEIVRACKYVHDAFIVNQFDNKPYLEQFNVDAIIHGDDWDREGYLRQIRISEEYLTKKNIELLFIRYTSGISTSEVINKIKKLS
jgi:cytidyltransferase-like protein